MSSVQKHYEDVLAPIYVWMVGGLEAALEAGAQEVAALPAGNGIAVDLGAGFGMHAVPLARNGYEVVAIDNSPLLLDVLRENCGDLPVRPVQDDLTKFRQYLPRPASLIVCLGDTLTHLADAQQVDGLLQDAAASLEAGGRLVLSFRDYTRAATGDARFIHVRSDTNRIHTCFLEELPQHMLVHDIVHERDGDVWHMSVGSYRKVRLAPRAVLDTLARAGLQATLEPGARGMVRITAVRT
jgi:SAM-dependent methyltransferase